MHDQIWSFPAFNAMLCSMETSIFDTPKRRLFALRPPSNAGPTILFIICGLDVPSPAQLRPCEPFLPPKHLHSIVDFFCTIEHVCTRL